MELVMERTAQSLKQYLLQMYQVYICIHHHSLICTYSIIQSTNIPYTIIDTGRSEDNAFESFGTTNLAIVVAAAVVAVMLLVISVLLIVCIVKRRSGKSKRY